MALTNEHENNYNYGQMKLSSATFFILTIIISACTFLLGYFVRDITWRVSKQPIKQPTASEVTNNVEAQDVTNTATQPLPEDVEPALEPLELPTDLIPGVVRSISDQAIVIDVDDPTLTAIWSDGVSINLTTDTIYTNAELFLDAYNLPDTKETALSRGDIKPGDKVTAYTVENLLAAAPFTTNKIQRINF